MSGCCGIRNDVSVMPYIGRSGVEHAADRRRHLGDDELTEAVDASYAAIVGQAAQERPPGLSHSGLFA